MASLDKPPRSTTDELVQGLIHQGREVIDVVNEVNSDYAERPDRARAYSALRHVLHEERFSLASLRAVRRAQIQGAHRRRF